MRGLVLHSSLVLFLISVLLKESTEKLYVGGLVSLIALREIKQTGELFYENIGQAFVKRRDVVGDFFQAPPSFYPSYYHSPILTSRCFRCTVLLILFEVTAVSKYCLTLKYICYPVALGLSTLKYQEIPKYGEMIQPTSGPHLEILLSHSSFLSAEEIVCSCEAESI